MFEDAQSFQLTVYMYGLALAIGAAAWIILAAWLGKKKKLPESTVLFTGVLAVPLGLLFARLVYCLVSLGYFQETIGQPIAMLYFWDGGFSMVGALLGISLAALMAAWIKKARPGELMDVLAVPAGLFIAIERLGETYTILGRGRSVGVETLRENVFFGIRDAWSDDVFYAVFRYEALAALLIFAVMLCLFFSGKARQTAKPGDLALVFGALYGSVQVVMESLRDDGHLLWGFVRFSQIASILLPVAAIVVFSVRLIKREGFNWRHIAAWVVAIACIVVGVLKEFDIDTSNNLLREYTIMSLAMAGLTAVALLLWRRLKRTV